jgi:hypothetical protein
MRSAPVVQIDEDITYKCNFPLGLGRLVSRTIGELVSLTGLSKNLIYSY